MTEVRAIQTGEVSVKGAHRSFAGPGALALPSILLDPRWTEWLPVYCWLVLHPDGPILVDTGESVRVNSREYFREDRATGWFYRRCLRFRVREEQELAAGLARAGVAPSDLRAVILTHTHSDHAGGLPTVAGTPTHAPPGYRTTRGALPGRWPRDFEPSIPEYGPTPFGALPSGVEVQRGVWLIPTPGHAVAHQSVLIESTPNVLIAGDASFDDQQLVTASVGGIAEDRRIARRTLRALCAHCAAVPTVYLPSHDPGAARRLEQRRTTSP